MGLLRWIGGKFLLSDFIISKMVKHDTFVSCFAGAMHIEIKKKPAKENYVNDINSNLINLYDVVKSEELCQQLIKEINKFVYSEELFLRNKKEYNLSKSTENKIVAAANFIYLNRVSFNGEFKTFSLDTKHWNIDYVTNQIMKLFLFFNKNRFVFMNKHFNSVLINPKFQQKECLVYLDPPYWIDMKKKYYQYGMTLDDHYLLFELLSKANFKWLLSYDNVTEVRKMYKDFSIIKTPELNQSAANFSKRINVVTKNELLIANYDLNFNSQIDLF